ncbi:hypothetical protein LG202_06010 [Methylobacillus methanolivorans]
MSLQVPQSFTAGRYVITPISQAIGNGKFSSVILVRSGQGTTTHSRIFSFTSEFNSIEKAIDHGVLRAQQWLNNQQIFASKN